MTKTNFDIEKCRECFKTEPDQAYFWHDQTNGIGGADNAAKIARENGGKTLEMVMKENKDKLIECGAPYDEDTGQFIMQDEEFADICSKTFAQEASGVVHVIAGTDKRPEQLGKSTFERVEYDELVNNAAVNGTAIVIDPYTGYETGKIVFDRSRPTGAELFNESAKETAGPTNAESAVAFNESAKGAASENAPSDAESQGAEQSQTTEISR